MAQGALKTDKPWMWPLWSKWDKHQSYWTLSDDSEGTINVDKITKSRIMDFSIMSNVSNICPACYFCVIAKIC